MTRGATMVHEVRRRRELRAPKESAPPPTRPGLKHWGARRLAAKLHLATSWHRPVLLLRHSLGRAETHRKPTALGTAPAATTSTYVEGMSGGEQRDRHWDGQQKQPLSPRHTFHLGWAKGGTANKHRKQRDWTPGLNSHPRWVRSARLPIAATPYSHAPTPVAQGRTNE